MSCTAILVDLETFERDIGVACSRTSIQCSTCCEDFELQQTCTGNVIAMLAIFFCSTKGNEV